MTLVTFSAIGALIIFAGAYFGARVSHEEEPVGGGSTRWDDDGYDCDFDC